MGPRGNGKTALLRWLESTCAESALTVGTGKAAAPIETVLLTPDEMSNLAAIAQKLAPSSRFKPSEFGIGLKAMKANWRLSAPQTFTDLITARCKKRPLMLLVDEAHTLDVEVGGALLNASQKITTLAPFLLVFAGTPDLQERMNRMGATFWDRCEPVAVGRLTAQASAQALVKPLSEQGIVFAEDPLAAAVSDSQHYPYFLQLWGAGIADILLRTGKDIVDATVVRKAHSIVAERRGKYYKGRYQELQRHQLLGPAAVLAKEFAGRGALDEAQLVDILSVGQSQLDADELQAQIDSLQRLGYIWQADLAKTSWEPGIPSLMAYVIKQPSAKRLLAKSDAQGPKAHEDGLSPQR